MPVERWLDYEFFLCRLTRDKRRQKKKETNRQRTPQAYPHTPKKKNLLLTPTGLVLISELQFLFFKNRDLLLRGFDSAGLARDFLT